MKLMIRGLHIEWMLMRSTSQAVEMFLDEKIGYLDIVKQVEATCEAHKADLSLQPSLDDIVEADLWARRHTREAVERGSLVAA